MLLCVAECGEMVQRSEIPKTHSMFIILKILLFWDVDRAHRACIKVIHIQHTSSLSAPWHQPATITFSIVVGWLPNKMLKHFTLYYPESTTKKKEEKKTRKENEENIKYLSTRMWYVRVCEWEKMKNLLRKMGNVCL